MSKSDPDRVPDRPAKIVSPTAVAIAEAADYLRAGRLVGLPTETVYGLAARGDDEDAVGRIFTAKGRPATNPLILHVATPAQARDLLAINLPSIVQHRFERATQFWPGPLTVVGPRRTHVLDIITAGQETVAIRIPSHPVALALLASVDFPIAAPSANPSNYISPTTATHVVDGLGDAIAMVLDGGPCDVGLESTILSLGDETSPPQLLRSGAISLEEVQDILGEPVVATSSSHSITKRESFAQVAMTSPGQLPKHYSPRTPLQLVEAASTDVSISEGQRVLLIRIVDTPEDGTASLSHYAEVWTLAPSGDLREAASSLYAMLRAADDGRFDRIDVDRCSEIGLGITLMDRLRRAASK